MAAIAVGRYLHRDDVVSCNRIPVFANECENGAFQESLRGITGHQKWVETGENDAKSWNDTPSEDIIESTDRRCDQNRIHLGNVGSPEELHKLAGKIKQAAGAHTGDKASCHSDYVNDETAKTLQAVELVELETP